MVTKTQFKREASNRLATLYHLNAAYNQVLHQTLEDLCKMQEKKSFHFEKENDITIPSPYDPDETLSIRSVYFDGMAVLASCTNLTQGVPDTINVNRLGNDTLLVLVASISQSPAAHVAYRGEWKEMC